MYISRLVMSLLMQALSLCNRNGFPVKNGLEGLLSVCYIL